jgi:pectinesterase
MKLLFALSFIAGALAGSRTSAPSGCLVVAKSGGQYTTVQAAVNALSTTVSGKQCIFVNPGTYSEQVLVPARTAQLTVYGYTSDTTRYAANQVTITASHSQAEGLNNDGTATLRVKAANFKLYNVNVNNGYGKGSQAVALSAYADSGYYGCQFTGFQDTLLANQGYQYYAGCMIQGATDFIFGQNAAAWFEGCDIRVLSASIGYITGKTASVPPSLSVTRLLTSPAANGRDSSSGTSYYVFNNCDVAAAAGNSVAAGAYYLGRPWREYARVVFQRTSMSAAVNAAGWRIWNAGDERTCCVLFGEYGNSGAGAQGTRASFTTKLGSAVSIGSILTSGYQGKGYFDGAYSFA